MKYQDFYDNHLRLLSEGVASGSADKLVENDYHEDAEMILMVADEPIYIKGIDELKVQLGNYVKYIYKDFISTEKLAMTEDSIFLEATINTTNGVSKVYDALYMKGDKIYRHYSGLKG